MLIILVRSGGVQPRGWREGEREGGSAFLGCQVFSGVYAQDSYTVV